MRTWTLYVCHQCGYVSAYEMDDFTCQRCGELRSEVEEVQVQEVPRDE